MEVPDPTCRIAHDAIGMPPVNSTFRLSCNIDESYRIGPVQVQKRSLETFLVVIY